MTLPPAEVPGCGELQGNREMEKDGVLTAEVVSRCVSKLGRLGTGLQHLYHHLSLPSRDLHDVSVLCSYVHLQKLELPHNKIKDLSCVSHMPYLVILDASHNEIASFFGFQPPKNLKEVNFSHNRMTKMKDLSAYSSLSNLDLGYNNLREISGLEQCCKLTHLNLAHNRILRISGLDRLPLTNLCLKGNQLARIEGLENLKSLQVLDLSLNRIISLTGLQNLHLLGSLNLEKNRISEIQDCKHIHDLYLLRDLNLLGNPVQDQPDYRLAVIFLLQHLTVLDQDKVTAEEKVSSVNKYDPPMDVVAARDHMTQLVYQLMQPQVLYDSTMPSADSPYPMLVLAGPQGCGKRELAHRLCQELSEYFAYGTCHTTRGPYLKEENGVDYHFVSEEDFQTMIHMGKFIQTMQYGGHSYGLTRDAVEDVAREGLACCVHMELEGVLSLKNSYFEPRYILLIPTQLEKYVDRLKSRGLYTPAQIDMAVSRIELYANTNRQRLGFFDNVIPCDDWEEAYQTLRQVVKEYLLLEEQEEEEEGENNNNRGSPDNTSTGHEPEEEKPPSPPLSRSGSGPLASQSAIALDPSDPSHRNYLTKIQAQLSPQKSPAELASIRRREQLVREAIVGKSPGVYSQLFKSSAQTAPSPLQNPDTHFSEESRKMRSQAVDPLMGEVMEGLEFCWPSTTATDETKGVGLQQTSEDQTRHCRRLQKLREHHDKCEDRYNKACVMTAHEEEEKMTFLRQLNLTLKQSSCESDDTITLDLCPQEDTSVPELRRTDSVRLHKEMFGYTEESPSSSDISDNKYLPESDESESDSQKDRDSSPDVKQPKKKKKRQRVQKTTSASSLELQTRKRRCVTPSSSLAANNPPESSSPGSSEPTESSSPDVTVIRLKKKEDGSRLYTKRFYCVFCCKPYRKMSRHLECKHSDKPEVAKALKCPKGSKERRLLLSLLRNKGNRVHNNKVIKEGKGMVIPHRQSSKPSKAGDYLHCINCDVYLKRKSLWRHMQKCHMSKEEKGLKPGTSRFQALCKYAEPVPDTVNAQFWKLVLDMRDDDITKVVRSEKCILKFGEHLFSKHGQHVTKHKYIRLKMREIGRVVLQGQKDGKLKMLSDFFVPANFPHVIEAVKKVAGLDEKTNIYRTPSLALKLGHNLKKVADVLECEAMISGDENTIHNVRIFKQICETKWGECVFSHALEINEAKWNVPQLLPFAEDVRKMHQYLEEKRMKCQRNLKEEVVKKNWAELSKVTLCEVILFNRRREGEVSKMPLSAFTLRDTSVTHPDVQHALSEVEKMLCKHVQQIEIKGKCGRKVPILLTPDVVSSMDLLVQNRSNCDVLDENPYMFGRPQTLSHFRGSDVIRQMAQSCGANHPEALSSTKLGKHMAIMSKVLNLKDNEMDDLADFFGHDIRVHRQYDRLPEGTLQLVKISKVLMALERGQLSSFKGKKLDEICIDPQEKMSVDSASDTEEEVDSTGRDAAFSPSSSKSSGEPGMTKICTAEMGQNKDLPLAKGPSQTKKLKWSPEEIQAVEKTLMNCIESGKVPGKAQCIECIEASPVVLRGRTWQGVKCYVRDHMDALIRETFKRSSDESRASSALTVPSSAGGLSGSAPPLDLSVLGHTLETLKGQSPEAPRPGTDPPAVATSPSSDRRPGSNVKPILPPIPTGRKTPASPSPAPSPRQGGRDGDREG